jgi:hypothetical protein
MIELKAESGQLRNKNQKPIGCLLGACSGRRPMGFYRFSLLTLLFSGVICNPKPCPDEFVSENR